MAFEQLEVLIHKGKEAFGLSICNVQVNTGSGTTEIHIESSGIREAIIDRFDLEYKEDSGIVNSGTFGIELGPEGNSVTHAGMGLVDNNSTPDSVCFRKESV